MLQFLHFSNNMNQPDNSDSNYDRLWKIRTLFDQLNDDYTKFYSPSEHLCVDEIAFFEQRVIFNNLFQRNMNALV
jgi:hypothetical protein